MRMFTVGAGAVPFAEMENWPFLSRYVDDDCFSMADRFFCSVRLSRRRHRKMTVSHGQIEIGTFVFGCACIVNWMNLTQALVRLTQACRNNCIRIRCLWFDSGRRYPRRRPRFGASERFCRRCISSSKTTFLKPERNLVNSFARPVGDEVTFRSYDIHSVSCYRRRNPNRNSK